MDRRSFLIGSAALGLSLSGCSTPPSALQVRSLKSSIPAQVLSEFQKQFKGTGISIQQEDQLQSLFALLQVWKQQSGQKAPSSPGIPFAGKKPENPADLVTIGDYWLALAIRQGLIQPIDPQDWQQWNALPEKWRSIVTRNDQGLRDPKGKVWGAPYRWGATVIAYRKDIFEQKGLKPPTDWADLWRSDLKGHISLLDQPRETIGLTLKKLGQSYNTADLTKVNNLESELRSLQQNVKFYSSDSYLQPLMLEDTWVAVGWSQDVLAAMRREPSIAAVFPAAGSALWADLWIRPSVPSGTVNKADAIAQWINFCWQPAIAPQLSLLSQAASPILTTLKELPEELKQNPILAPDAAVIDRSDFLEPIADATADQYRRYWETLRQAG